MFLYTVLMSTGKSNNTADRFKKLAEMGEVLFHAGDLANLWQIKDKNTLYTTLKRYAQKGLLHRIHKGFYSLKRIEDIDPILLGVRFLNGFAYLSTETVLARHGIIFQNPSSITLIGSKSEKFSLGGNFYIVRQLSDKYLFNFAGINSEDGYYLAEPERAVADLLYFNPDHYLDGEDLVDWAKVYRIQKEVGYKVTK
jgi:predicted transcriptional regulator of viral defense system